MRCDAGSIRPDYALLIVEAVASSSLARHGSHCIPTLHPHLQVAPIIERVPSAEEVGAPASPGELQQPLLAEEAPTPTAERTALAKALAIVRYIEAVTELGAVPPAGESRRMQGLALPGAA